MSTPARYHTEWINGQEIEKALPKKLHALVQRFLLLWFSKQLTGDRDCLQELNVICGSDRIVPDLVVFLKGDRFVDDDLADPPLLAVEVSSPKQSLSSLLEKCERLAAAGTPMCWIIVPERQQAFMFSNSILTEAKDVLWADSQAYQLPLADLWADLPREDPS